MGFLKRRSVQGKFATLLAIAALVASPGWAGPSKEHGRLSIDSDPDGAAVYFDGRSAGTTPVTIADASMGSHRVRIVKNGYLENSQVVTVRADRRTHLTVKLTRTSAELQSPSQSAPTASTWSNKWLWIGLAGGGAAVTAIVLTRNNPPLAGTIQVSPTATGMAGQTSFTIRSTGAQDPDDDPLTFTWNFGDGGSGTGETITHTYAAAGTYQVQLAISDGKDTVNAPATTVVVGPSIGGTWTGGSIMMPDPIGNLVVNCGLNLELTQNGESVSGSMRFTGGCTGGPGALSSGTASPLTHPSRVSVASGQFTFPPAELGTGLVVSFVGMTNTAGTTLTGNITLARPASNFVRTTATSFNKQ